MFPTIRESTAHGDLIILKCGHFYHHKCIEQWCNSANLLSGQCPICRQIPHQYTIRDEVNLVQTILLPIEANVYVPDGALLLFL